MVNISSLHDEGGLDEALHHFHSIELVNALRMGLSSSISLHSVTWLGGNETFFISPFERRCLRHTAARSTTNYTMKLSSTAAATTLDHQSSSSTVDDGVAACCLFCLDAGPDADTGHPLIRDCSCRGDSAGYIHLPCLIEYAKDKSGSVGTDLSAFASCWTTCLNCKQRYQNKLAYELAIAFTAFAEETYGRAKSHTSPPLPPPSPPNCKWDVVKIMTAIKSQIQTCLHNLLNPHNNSTCIPPNEAEGLLQLRVEIVQHVQKLLTLVAQTKTEYNINSWIHKPKTSMEYIYYSVICEDYEADVYDIWGAVTSMDENALPIAIQHLSKD